MKKSFFTIIAGFVLLFLLYGTSESRATNAQEAYQEITWAQAMISERESQGYDVSKHKKILGKAQQAYQDGKYRKAKKLAKKVRKMFLREIMGEVGIEKVIGPGKLYDWYDLPVPTKKYKPGVKVEPPPAPELGLTALEEYHLLYAAFQNWGINFNELYDIYSKKAWAGNWTTFWIGSTANTDQRVHFDRTGYRWRPRSADIARLKAAPIATQEIPPKPDSLIASNTKVTDIPISECRRIAVLKFKDAPNAVGSGEVVTNLIIVGLAKKGYDIIGKEKIDREMEKAIEEQKAKGKATDEEKAILSISEDNLVAQDAESKTTGLILATLQESVKQERKIREETVDITQIGKAANADAVVTGVLSRYGDITVHAAVFGLAGFIPVGEGVSIEIQVIDPQTGFPIWQDSGSWVPKKAMDAKSIAQEVVKAILNKIPERKEESQ